MNEKPDLHGVTPDEARENKISVEDQLKLELKATRIRTYPDLYVDDKVNIYKKKEVLDKEKSSYGQIKHTHLKA